MDVLEGGPCDVWLGSAGSDSFLYLSSGGTEFMISRRADDGKAVNELDPFEGQEYIPTTQAETPPCPDQPSLIPNLTDF